MSRIVIVLNMDPSLDVEAYRIAGQLQDIGGVRSVEVRTLEDGDELVKFSVVKDALRESLAAVRIPDPWPDTATGEDLDRLVETTELGEQYRIRTPEEAEAYERARAERQARREAEMVERVKAQQAQRRAELEAYDQDAARVVDARRHEVRLPPLRKSPYCKIPCNEIDPCTPCKAGLR